MHCYRKPQAYCFLEQARYTGNCCSISVDLPKKKHIKSNTHNSICITTHHIDVLLQEPYLTLGVSLFYLPIRWAFHRSRGNPGFRNRKPDDLRCDPAALWCVRVCCKQAWHQNEAHSTRTTCSTRWGTEQKDCGQTVSRCFQVFCVMTHSLKKCNVTLLST